MSLNKGFLNHLYLKYGENPGKMLVHTGTIGWILSCVAQVGSILLNNKISDDVKGYLIPQEIGDGAINILSFYILTSGIKGLASILARTGKITNKAIRAYLKKYNLTENIGKINFDISKTKNFSEIKDEYVAFKNGVDVIASTGGAILSCNIVTPILRNNYATVKQREIKKQNIANISTDSNEKYQMYNRISFNDYRKNLFDSNLKI